MLNFKLLLVGIVVMIILDLVWIGGFMSGFYKDNLKHFLRFGENGNLLPRIIPTVFVYVAATILLMVFVMPLVKASLVSGNSIWIASLWGALAGLLIYAFYDLTNLALFEKWTVIVTIVDMLWGMCLFYLTTVILALI